MIKQRTVFPYVIPFLIFLSYLFLSRENLSVAIPEITGATGLIVILISFYVFLGEKAGYECSPYAILICSALFRLLFLWRPPELSDDIYRYVFDGLMVIGGNSPYQDAPVNVEGLSPAAQELIPLINHNEMTTIYPPGAQIVFSAGAFLGGVFGMKLLLIMMDVATCALLLKLLKSLSLPLSRAVLYGWSPLPTLEIGASGHIDSAALFFLFCSFALLMPNPKENNRPGDSLKALCPPLLAGLLAAFSIFTKWYPLIYIPGLLLWADKWKRGAFLFGLMATSLVLTFLFMPEFCQSFVTLGKYLRNWEFAGFIFRVLRVITGSGGEARIICASLFMLATVASYWMAGRKGSLSMAFKGGYAVSLSYLLITPTLHPWYALYLVAFLPLCPGPAGILLSWSVFLGYVVLIPYHLSGLWIENTWSAGLIFSAPLAAFFLFFIFHKFNFQHFKT